MAFIADIHIETIRASTNALRGCDPLRPLTPQQVFNVVHAYRTVLNEFEKQAVEDLAQVGVGPEAQHAHTAT